ncbi:MAG: hypothetical protein R3327_02500 [Nitrosopumilaceae archaeon]|nr:hypothetical protein [Nitrosopumilaceae archaeon]
MFYHFEIQLAGVILLSAMAIGGISLWYKRRKTRLEEQRLEDEKNEPIDS